MDLTGVRELVPARSRADLARLGPHSTVLAGGTWLFSTPQPDVHALLDLTTLGWPPVEVHAPEDDVALTVAATCTIAELGAVAAQPGWTAHPLLRRCAQALLASGKVQHVATVGGNICLALPAGAMTTLAVALEGVAVVWTTGGGERRLPVERLVVGDRRTSLRPGEVLRAVEVPAAALRSRVALRRASLTPVGRSAALLVGRRDGAGLALTVTASLPQPVVLRFAAVPSAQELADAVDGIAARRHVPWFDDVHGAPDWRRAMTLLLAEEIRAELEED